MKSETTAETRTKILTQLNAIEITSNASASAMARGMHLDSMIRSAQLSCHDLRGMIVEMTKVIGDGDPTRIALDEILRGLE